MAYQARCPRCRLHFRWVKSWKLKGAHCPYCKTPLRMTTHLCKDPVSTRVPDYRVRT
mgnify:CR=1 FL=1